MFYGERPTDLTLTWDEISMCAKYGDLITEENKGIADSRNYTAKQLTDRQGNILGVIAEYSFLKAIGKENDWEGIWIPFTKLEDYGPNTTGKPDVADKYEIRRAHYMNSGIPIRAKDRKANAIIVQAFVGYTNLPGGKIRATKEVNFLGWTDAVNDYDTASETNYRSYDTKTQHNKRPMSTLDLSYVLGGVAA